MKHGLDSAAGPVVAEFPRDFQATWPMRYLKQPFWRARRKIAPRKLNISNGIALEYSVVVTHV